MHATSLSLHNAFSAFVFLLPSALGFLVPGTKEGEEAVGEKVDFSVLALKLPDRLFEKFLKLCCLGFPYLTPASLHKAYTVYSGNR